MSTSTRVTELCLLPQVGFSAPVWIHGLMFGRGGILSVWFAPDCTWRRRRHFKGTKVLFCFYGYRRQ
jgi:hypothetical protein